MSGLQNKLDEILNRAENLVPIGYEDLRDAHRLLDTDLPLVVHALQKAMEGLKAAANPEGVHTDALFQISSDCSDGDYYRDGIKKARLSLAEIEKMLDCDK